MKTEISKPLFGLHQHMNSIQQLAPSASLASMAHSDNFYQAIEQLPFVPLSVKFQVKDQMAEMEKSIRQKRKKN